MMPVTKRAGVTSKPGFATGVPSGAKRTVALAPATREGLAALFPAQAVRSRG